MYLHFLAMEQKDAETANNLTDLLSPIISEEIVK